MVHDSERRIAGSLVGDLCLCRRLGVPNTQQMVLHFARNLQRGDILVHRTIQAIDLCVQSYPLRGFVARQRINIEETTGTCYKVRQRHRTTPRPDRGKL